MGSRYIQEGSLEIGTLMAFIQYTTQMLNGLTMFANLLTIFPRTTASVYRVKEVIEYPSRKVGEEEQLKEAIYSIEANDLEFYYPNANTPALNGINFKINSGEVLGIIGGTGSGKSTLLKLLMQFYDPTNGQLILNNQSIEELNPEIVRNRISYVPQQNFFFTDTIRGNMQYSNPNVQDKTLLQHFKTTQADVFLRGDRPLDRKVIRGGQNFSGGQRQRLALARAIARESSVYIFDDSFSALDYRTDYEIRENLANVLDKSITIVVAQRVATIRHADKVLVLDDGVMAGYGSHNDLMQTSKLYQEIVSSQANEEESRYEN